MNESMRWVRVARGFLFHVEADGAAGERSETLCGYHLHRDAIVERRNDTATPVEDRCAYCERVIRERVAEVAHG